MLRALAAKSAWPIAERAIRMVLGFGIALAVAAHLGVTQYGAFAFAYAWASLFAGLAWLGIGDNVIRDLVEEPQRRDALLPTVMTLRLIGSLIATAAACALLPVLYPEQSRDVLLLAACMSAACVFGEIGGVPLLWFQSRQDLRSTFVARLVPFVVAQLARLSLVLAGASLLWFGLASPLETGLLALISWGLYWRSAHRGPRLSTDTRAMVTLLRESAPLLMAAVVAGLALRLDQLLLAKWGTLDDVGVYAAALRFSEIWWTMPALIMQAAGPMLLFGVRDEAVRTAHLRALYAGLLAGAGMVAVSVALTASWFVPLLLGASFARAADVLAIHVFVAVLVFADAVTNAELVRRRANHVMFAKALAALATTATLNAVLIPRAGAQGAAWAALGTFAVSTWLVPACFACSRDLLRLQAGAPLVWVRWLAHLARGARVRDR